MFHSDDVFREHLDKFLRRMLHKGVPPLFVILRPLYKDQEKVIRIYIYIYIYNNIYIYKILQDTNNVWSYIASVSA